MKDKAIVQEMRSNWLGLMDSLAVSQDVAKKLFSDLVAHYNGDGRHYHDLEHIRNVLGAIGRMEARAENATAIQLAAWYHDIIYEIDAKDNELRSAEYAIDALQDTPLSPETIELIAEMIRATDISKDPPDELDFRILLDADLATLASNYEYYDKNARAIRREFAGLSDPEYRVERQRLLNKFLKRERIFLTPGMFETSEAKARENIQREIDSLS
jgi:predicted metal-dependent HD superfamily phosphohydrolase